MKKAPITVPNHNTLIRIKYVAYISELTEDVRDSIKAHALKPSYIQGMNSINDTNIRNDNEYV